MNQERATAWQFTWYPPTDSMDFEISKKEIEEYAMRPLPPGYLIQGQMEQCPETKRYHYQAYLKSPQIRWVAAKKLLTYMDKEPHVEKAKNLIGLKKYCEKTDTRVAEIKSADKIPNCFEYQAIIAARWNWDEFKECIAEYSKQFPNKLPNEDELAMRYLDNLVAEDIESGRRGPEWIAVNPMWINSWKKFWRSIIKRHASSSTPPPSSEDGTPRPSGGGTFPADAS